MEKQKIKEALNLDIFLQSLLDLTESSDESSEDDEVNEVLSASMQTLPNSYYFPEDKSRQWLKRPYEEVSAFCDLFCEQPDLLLEEDNLESDDENIDEVIKIHKMILTYREQFHSDPSLSKYMYYSSDFITGENKWPSHFQTITKKLLKRKAQLNKQSRAKSSLSPTLNDQNVSTTSFVSRSYQHRVKSHAVNDKITHGNLVKKRAFSVSRRKSMNMAALRRYIWKIIVKKEIPKAYRQRVQNQSNKLALLKKASKDAAKKIRAKALESRMRCRKEVVVARARRMTREAQLFWKKYVRVEKTHRRQAEKEAITQKRIEDEKRERSVVATPNCEKAERKRRKFPKKMTKKRTGTDAVIVKNGKRICGTGGSLANASIVQDKAYFEAKLQSTGIWGIGIAHENCELDRVPLGEDAHSWVLRHDGLIRHNQNTLHCTTYNSTEGDIVGVSYDHVELNFYVNGKSLNSPVSGVRGTVFPVIYVDESAIVDVEFSNFTHPPPTGYKEIMVEQSIF